MHVHVLATVVAAAAVAGAATISAPAAAAPPDRTPPVVQASSASPATFYPVVDGFRDTKRVDFVVTDETTTAHTVLTIDVVGGPDNASLRTYTRSQVAPIQDSWQWDGRTTEGTLAPAGTYQMLVSATDPDGNVSESYGIPVTVSHARLVTKSFRRTVRAAGSKVDQFVGGCSALRRPSARGWTGSLGLYSNTRCRSDGQRSVVATAHAIRVPRAFQNRYGSLTVKLYGGAARSRPSSKALLEYLRVRDKEWVQDKFVGSPVGTKSGNTATAGLFVHEKSTEPWVAWGLMTAVGHRYDVRDFTVVLTYTVLQ